MKQGQVFAVNNLTTFTFIVAPHVYSAGQGWVGLIYDPPG